MIPSPPAAPSKRRRRWFAAILGLLVIGGDRPPGQDSTGAEPRSGPAPGTTWMPLASIRDPRMAPLRRAAAAWEARPGPSRSVVDQVCLVRDLAGFLEAVATWDRGHFFPVLFDDVETSDRFIRAFRPARIVRMNRSPAPIAADRTWDRSVEAVGASWKEDGRPSSAGLRGDVPPRELGPTPPGLVLSSPGAPMLAGAVALAAGRFQPLVRFDFEKHYADVLSAIEVEALDLAIAEKARRLAPDFDRLGDDCDFLTVAGDWPFRCRDEKGEHGAVDDRIGRSPETGLRWAFTGRLLGDPAQGAYRAMCSLFLQPDSALMFNGYDESSPPWSLYAMRDASRRFSAVVPTSQVSGEGEAGLGGWHETFDPSNRAGLVLINSHGSPTVFNLRGGPASTADVPRTVPSAVLMIHSFSAADPTDPSTIAGRWLANGAFLYFGSMNEPYLQSFRPPLLLQDLIAEGLPMAAAVRSGPAEPYGRPWRLVLLGDPLYRVRPGAVGIGPRIARWGPTESWLDESAGSRPETDQDVALALWALQAGVARLATSGASSNPKPGDDLVETLLAIRRDRLPVRLLPRHDALLVETLFAANRRSALRSKIAKIPAPARSATLRRALETLLAIDLNLALARGDVDRARATWSDLMKADALREFKEQSTARVGKLADTPDRRRDWVALLRSTRGELANPADAAIVEAELKRVEPTSGAGR